MSSSITGRQRRLPGAHPRSHPRHTGTQGQCGCLSSQASSQAFCTCAGRGCPTHAEQVPATRAHAWLLAGARLLGAALMPTRAQTLPALS
jgi:hypothetical protein